MHALSKTKQKEKQTQNKTIQNKSKQHKSSQTKQIKPKQIKTHQNKTNQHNTKITNTRRTFHTDIECVPEGYANGRADVGLLAGLSKEQIIKNAAKKFGEFLNALGPGRGYCARGGMLNFTYSPILESRVIEFAEKK